MESRALKELVDLARMQGFRCLPTTDGYRVYPKDQTGHVLHVRRCEDNAARRNAMAALRRMGVKIPHANAQKPKEKPMQESLKDPRNPHRVEVAAMVKAVDPLMDTLAREQFKPSPEKPQAADLRTDYDRIRDHIDQAVDHMASAQDLLNRVRAKSEKLQKLRDLLSTL